MEKESANCWPKYIPLCRTINLRTSLFMALFWEKDSQIFHSHVLSTIVHKIVRYLFWLQFQRKYLSRPQNNLPIRLRTILRISTLVVSFSEMYSNSPILKYHCCYQHFSFSQISGIISMSCYFNSTHKINIKWIHQGHKCFQFQDCFNLPSVLKATK